MEWEYVRGGVPSAVRGDHHVLTSDGGNRTFETVLGDEGTLIIADDVTFGGIAREIQSPQSAWESQNRILRLLNAAPPGFECDLTARPSLNLGTEIPWRMYPWRPSAAGTKPPHEYHLANFFDAIRGSAKLTCPAEVAYPASVTVLRAIEAMRTRRRVALAPDEFVV
jgi:predicted dehydrogenase